ncbi:hypothetical protein BKM63_21260 [Flavobacterium johnsoniae]|uniref:Uncharacterized protein n=1 Tax=Flavobacterium johnsoniae TaxID=986 RepID=A0A1J7CEH7_FLAJO|nr:hypothetical protein BKM63_21260 [Flavobacterium johnsoniae]
MEKKNKSGIDLFKKYLKSTLLTECFFYVLLLKKLYISAQNKIRIRVLNQINASKPLITGHLDQKKL